MSDSELKVDFEFLDPKPVHFHSLKNLLTLLFRGEGTSVCLSGLADHLIGQAGRFGIVWQQCEEACGSCGSESESGSSGSEESCESEDESEESGSDESNESSDESSDQCPEQDQCTEQDQCIEQDQCTERDLPPEQDPPSQSTLTSQSTFPSESNPTSQSTLPAEEGEIFGICTFVCLDSDCPADFKRFIQSKQPKAKDGDLVFLSSRPANVPFEICKSAYPFLVDDLCAGEEAVKNVFTLCPMAFAVDETDEGEHEGEGKKRKKKKIQLHLFPENEMLEGFGSGSKSVVKVGGAEKLFLIGLEKEDFVAYLRAVIDL